MHILFVVFFNGFFVNHQVEKGSKRPSIRPVFQAGLLTSLERKKLKARTGGDPWEITGGWLFGGMGWSLMVLEDSLERGSFKWDPLIGGIQTKAKLRFLIEVSL